MKGIVDTTLREGEQAAYVYFDPKQKLNIIDLLTCIGIEEIELGIAVKNPEMKELFKQARKQTPVRLSLWCRCLPSDIDETLSLNPDVIAMSVPVSDIHIEHKLRKTRQWVLETTRRSIAYLREKSDLYISLGLEDASRADLSFVAMVCEVAQKEGVNRIRFADTLGILNPLEIYKIVQTLKSHFSLDIGVHTHNDFGMATANAIAAILAGADFVDVTVCGLGERAGNAALEEVVAFLVKRMGSKHYTLFHLHSLCRYVAETACIPISPKKPIVGEEIFVCESGIHIDGLLKCPQTYEPLIPEELGLKREILIGKKTGKNAITAKLTALGIKLTHSQLDEVLKQVKITSSRLNRCLSDKELLQIVHRAA